MTTTAHLGITLLEQSQAQKEVTVNEAFSRVDALLNSGVIDKDLATPPSSPGTGDVYIVAASPTGDWTGQANAIAYFDQIWRFIVPNAGAMLWVDDEALHYVFNGTSWVAVVVSSGDMMKSTYDPANIGQQLVGTTATQALTNKTLTAPVIATISNTGTLTLPTSTDTLVGRAHELEVLKLQMEYDEKKLGLQQESDSAERALRLQEIQIDADTAEGQQLNERPGKTGITWVDALSGSVRPILTYAFFILYFAVKICQFRLLLSPMLPWISPISGAQAIVVLWTQEDVAIFSAVVGFWFGHRTMQKAREWAAR